MRTLALPIAVAALAATPSGCTDDERVATIESPPASGGFATIRAGHPLPDDATCWGRVRRSIWEPRPANTEANNRVPTAAERGKLATWSQSTGFDDRARTLSARISGNFTGTTDEILQWAACKWGFNEDLVRAMAVHSTRWRQTGAGCWTTTASDCPSGAATRTTGSATECAGCYGILQIKWKSHPTTWPMSRDSTAFSADYVIAYLRACFEGWMPYLARNAPSSQPYRPDDEWSCVGVVFSGDWHDTSAINATAATRDYYDGRAWTRPGF